jgi:hypothetical protein
MRTNTIDRERVAELMRRLADDDLGAIVPFIKEFGGCLAGPVRRTLRGFGRHDVLADRRRVDELVQEAAFVIAGKAAAWSPDGALPWTWAERAIRQAVVAELGHPTVELLPERFDTLVTEGAGAGSTPADEADVDFSELARRVPELGLLEVAIGVVGTARDQQVHVQYRVQKAMGDPSPAVTVGEQFGLRAEHVRQIDRRMRLRLQALVDGDERYAAIGELRWLVA